MNVGRIKLETAFRALNPIVGDATKRQKQHCRCDPDVGATPCQYCAIYDALKDYKLLIEDIEEGEASDGYHTFNELYYHRMVLFSVICHAYKNKDWKSKQHDDGTMFDNHFIVGVETPEGQYTYHYSMEHWDAFNVKELEKAPEWDGHKPEDIVRLKSLQGGEKPDPFKEHLAKDRGLDTFGG